VSGTSDTDDEGGEQKVDSVEQLSATLRFKTVCDAHPKQSCAIKEKEHVHLASRDFAQWATMIVSQQSHIPCGTPTKLVELAIRCRNRQEVPRGHR